MKRPAANAPRRRTRAAKARAGILRPSTFLPAPDAPPLMGTLDADDGGVAREVALLLLRLRHQRLLHPPPTSLSPEDSSSSPTTLGPAPRRGARSRPPMWIPHRQRALRPHVQCVGARTGPWLVWGGPPSRHWGASLRPPAPTPASVAPPLRPGVTVTTSPTPDGGLQVSAWMGHVGR